MRAIPDDIDYYLNLAGDVVRLAKQHGADDADTIVRAGTEFEVDRKSVV